MSNRVLFLKKPLLLLALAVLPASPAAAYREVICAGDCNYDGSTNIDELMTGVDILLGGVQLAACAGIDLNGDGSVTVADLIAGVRNALDGCPSARFEPTACD